MANRSSVGVVVGPLVIAEVRMPVDRDWAGDTARDPRHEIRRFTRVVVPREVYAQVRLLASRAGVTVERYLGVLVEEAFPTVSR
jgi:hypothetical protein